VVQVTGRPFSGYLDLASIWLDVQSPLEKQTGAQLLHVSGILMIGFVLSPKKHKEDCLRLRHRVRPFRTEALP
jgi:hypothetical protein